MRTKSKKVLLLLKLPPPYGGGEIRAEFLKNYVKNDPRFVIIERRRKSARKATQGKFQFSKIKENIVYLFNFIQILQKVKPMLVFVPLGKKFLSFFYDSLFFWIAYLFNTPCVTELPGSQFDVLKQSKLARWYGRLILSKLKSIRVLSNKIAKYLEGYGITNTVVFDNGVFVGCNGDYDSKNNRKPVKLLFVGVISPQKGFDVLVEAFRRMIENGKDIELYVLGEWISDNYKKAVIFKINECKMQNRIFFEGVKLGKNKWEIFQRCHIFVLPSYNEGQPLSLLEAFGCGLPIIASKVGGIPETIVDGEHGFLIEPGSVDQLSGKLSILIDSPTIRMRMSIANSLLFKERYTIDRYLNNYVNWLLNIF